MAIIKDSDDSRGVFFNKDIVIQGSNNPKDFELFYSIDPNRWYQTYPFYFDVMLNGRLATRFFLPIPPQSMTVQNLSTSEAHATMGGVVEETSDPVFTTITLVGTTGMSAYGPQHGGAFVTENSSPSFRKTFDQTTGQLNPLARLASNVIDGLLDNTVGAVEQENRLPYATYGSSVNTPLSEELKNLTPEQATDVSTKNFFEQIGSVVYPSKQGSGTIFANGYSWSHALRQLFLVYAKAKGSNPNYELYFVDAKANTRYRCVPRSVQFQQTAQNPFMSQYNIVLKCWNLTGTSGTGSSTDKTGPLDRFGPKGDLQEVNSASITGLITRVSKVIKNWNRKKDIAGAMVKNSLGSIV